MTRDAIRTGRHGNVFPGFGKLRDREVQRRLWRKVQVLEARPEAGTPLVSAADSVLGRLYRLRIGDYRVIYAVQHAKRRVILVAVGHRKRVYRDFMD